MGERGYRILIAAVARKAQATMSIALLVRQSTTARSQWRFPSEKEVYEAKDAVRGVPDSKKVADLTTLTRFTTTRTPLACANGSKGAENAMPEEEQTHPLCFVSWMLGDRLDLCNPSVTHLKF